MYGFVPMVLLTCVSGSALKFQSNLQKALQFRSGQIDQTVFFVGLRGCLLNLTRTRS